MTETQSVRGGAASGANPPLRVGLLGFGAINRIAKKIIDTHGDAVLTGIATRSGVDASGSTPILKGIDQLLETKPDVVLMATSAILDDVVPDILTSAAAGVGVVSTCEELAFPVGDSATQAAAEIDRVARDHAVAVGTGGVNPGFIYDYLPGVFSVSLPRIDSMSATRVIDMRGFGETRFRDLGLGMTEPAFQAARAEGRVNGHVGYIPTGHYLAWRLGWSGEVEVVQTYITQPAESTMVAGGRTFEKGEIIRLRQIASVLVDKRERIHLEVDLHMNPSLDGLNEVDRVEFRTDDDLPPTVLTVSPSLPAARTGAAVAVNALRWVADANPGFHSLKDWHRVAIWRDGQQ